MKATVTTHAPNEILVSITITMPIGRWRALGKQIAGISGYPVSKFSHLINDTVRRMDQQYEVEVKEG